MKRVKSGVSSKNGGKTTPLSIVPLSSASSTEITDVYLAKSGNDRATFKEYMNYYNEYSKPIYLDTQNKVENGGGDNECDDSNNLYFIQYTPRPLTDDDESNDDIHLHHDHDSDNDDIQDLLDVDDQKGNFLRVHTRDITPQSITPSTSTPVPVPLLAKANLAKLTIPGKYKSISNDSFNCIEYEYVINNGNWPKRNCNKKIHLTPPAPLNNKSSKKHVQETKRSDNNNNNNNYCYNMDTYSPLSLVFSTTSGIHLISSECNTPSDDDSNDETETWNVSPSEHYEENWNQIDFEQLKNKQTIQQQLNEELLAQIPEIDEDETEDESYWREKCKEFTLNKMASSSMDSNHSSLSMTSSIPSYSPSLPSLSYQQQTLTLSSTSSDTSSISDICLEFPFCSKEEEMNFELSQMNHNSIIDNIDIAQTRQIGQDLFHPNHITAWQANQKPEVGQKYNYNKNKKKK